MLRKITFFIKFRFHLNIVSSILLASMNRKPKIEIIFIQTKNSNITLTI